MASKTTACIPLASNANEGVGVFGFGGTAEKGGSGKLSWNTVRQGEIWINGLIYEHEVYMINETASFNDTIDAWGNRLSEVDWITNEIALQELISKDGATSHSDSHVLKKVGFNIQQQDYDMKRTSVTSTGGWPDLGAGFHNLPGPGESPKGVTAGRGKEGIWAPNTPFRGNTEIANGTRVSSSERPSSDTAWSGGDIGWYNIHTDFFEESQRLSLTESIKGAWLEHTAEKNFIQDTKDTRAYGSRDKEPMDSLEERKLDQGLHGNREIEEPTRKERLRGRKWPVHSPEIREHGGWECGDDNTLRMRKGNSNCWGEERGLQHFSSESSVVVEKLANGTLLCTGQECYVPEKESEVVDKYFMDEKCHGDENKSGSMPPEALLYAFPYLNWHDLLTVERVCKVFRDNIRDDALLWQRLHVEPPFSKKLTDERLLQMAARARGQLQCLSLVDCLRITEGAVEQVVRSNPRISKLCLPGCSRISAEAVFRMVKDHTDRKAVGMPGLKQLRIRNIYGLTREHLDSLQSMLGHGAQSQTSSSKPQFYLNGHYSLPCNDQRAIDVEACPKCGNARIVYDCTRERCQQRQGSKLQECRGCIFCIARCEECGRCINDNDYEETFCLDLLCSACWLRLPKCAECNRPGCGRHADHFIRTPDTTFVCGDCCGSSSGANGPEFHVLA